MCRWFTYLGKEPVLLEDVIIEPEHSILKQIDTRYLPDVHVPFPPAEDYVNNKSNLDGFGVSLYTAAASGNKLSDMVKQRHTLMPMIYKIIRPPLNDRNLFSLCDNMQSTCIFAHVRAAPYPSATVSTNNHPFIFGKFSFQQNGNVAYFTDMKLGVLEKCSRPARHNIAGSTDTEHVAALYFTHLQRDGPWTGDFTIEQMKKAMRDTLVDLLFFYDQAVILSKTEGESSPAPISTLNFSVTDGTQMVATRLAYPETQEPPSLYWSTTAGPTLCRRYNGSPNRKEKGIELRPGALPQREYGKHAIVASEPTTFVEEEWKLVPQHSMVVVGKELDLAIETI